MGGRNFLRWTILLAGLSGTGVFAAGPVVSDGGVVNNASYKLVNLNPAPGTLVAIFGSNLTDGTACVPAAGCYPSFDNNGRVLTTMSGAQVTVNGEPVPILYATPNQLGVQLPNDLTGPSAIVQVTVAGEPSAPRTIAIDAASPGIFTLSQDGRGIGTITHPDGTQVSPSAPVYPGQSLIIYATGLGQVTPPVPTGTVPSGTVTTVATPAVTIDGSPAQVLFSGLSGCCVGLNQIRIAVPSNVRIGNDISLVLSIGGKQSNTVTISTAVRVNLLGGAIPSSITFGDVSIGSSNTQTVTLTNTGSTSATVSQVDVTGNGFSLTGPELPLALAGGQTASFSVNFAPTASGGATGSLSILSDASSSTPILVPLSGSGTVIHFVDLTWVASSSIVVGYNVYRWTISGGPYAKLNSALIVGATYSDSNVALGQTYFYVATAVDATGKESVFSNEAIAVVPEQ